MFQAFFAIIFNNWGKTVIRLVFLFVSTIWTGKYCTKTFIFRFLFLFYFVIIFYSLSFHSLTAPPLFLIVLHKGVKTHSRQKCVISDVVSERRIPQSPFIPNAYFSAPWKHQKTVRFFDFSGGREREHWKWMG